jgi:hypothetical protein
MKLMLSYRTVSLAQTGKCSWDSSNNIEEFSTSVICFLNKCINDIVPTVTVLTYPNHKLSLKVSKTKKLIVDYRKRRAEHAPIHIDRAIVERVESFHTTKELTWSTHNNTVMKKARQHLFPLRMLTRFGMCPQILTRFYSCTIESILTG